MRTLVLMTSCAALFCAVTAQTSPARPGQSNLLNIAEDCRDTTIYHNQKVAFLMVLNFNASTFRWRTGYRRWTTLEKVGKNCLAAAPIGPIKYTYYFSNNKTEVKQDVVEVRVLTK